MTDLEEVPEFDIRIVRFRKTDFAVYGHLFFAGEQEAAMCTLEKPDLHNQPDVSCIPTGAYLAGTTWSPHLKYDCPELQDVPNRTDIRIHIANLPSELLGCIAVGQEFGEVQRHRDPSPIPGGILSSLPAFNKLMEYLKDKPSYTVQITEELS